MTENVRSFWPTAPAQNSGAQVADDTNTLREFWLAGRRQVWVLLVCAIAGLMLGAFHHATSPRQYYSSAKILIEERQSDLEQEISSLRPLTRNDTGFENQMQILRSGHLAAEVVRSLQLQDNQAFLSPPTSVLGALKSSVVGVIRSALPRLEAIAPAVVVSPEAAAEDRLRKAAAHLSRHTYFTRVGKSYAVEIGNLSHDPALSRDIVNAYAEAYLADGLQANLSASDRTATWMQERIEEIRQATLQASAEAERFRAANGAMDQQGLREREQRVDALNDLLLAIEARYQEHLIAGSYPMPTGRILSEALAPERPSEPKAWQALLAGLGVGMMVGLMIAVLRELRESGFRTGDDLGSQGLAFLGYLPVLPSRERISGEKKGQGGAVRTAADGSVVAFATGAEDRGRPRLLLEYPVERAALSSDLAIATLGAPYARASQGVLASIDLALDYRRAGVIGVSGLARGEGATTLASNIAHQAAEAGRVTLLIDGDTSGAGLTSLLLNLDMPGAERPARPGDPLRHVRRLPNGLEVLPAGGKAGPATGWASPMRGAIETARKSYDLILVDLPPLAHPEAKSLFRSLDGILIVVEWGETSRRSLESLLNREPELRKRAVGAVLNRTNLRRLARYGVPREEYRALVATPAA